MSAFGSSKLSLETVTKSDLEFVGVDEARGADDLGWERVVETGREGDRVTAPINTVTQHPSITVVIYGV